MSDVQDYAEVEDTDAGAFEQERPDNRDRRYEREADDGGDAEPDEPRQRQQPDRSQAEGRRARENRELKAELRALQERVERSERAKSSTETVDPIKAATEADWEKDPIGAGIATQAALRSYATEREQTAAQAAERTKQAERIGDLTRWAQEHVEDYRERRPDVEKAIDFMATSRKAELVAGGLSPEQADQAFGQELFGLLTTLRGQGKNPAAGLYAIAQKRGYNLDNGADMSQQKTNGSRGMSPFAGTGTRSGSGGVTVKSTAEAPRATLTTIRKGGDDFDRSFDKLRAAAKRR